MDAVELDHFCGFSGKYPDVIHMHPMVLISDIKERKYYNICNRRIRCNREFK